MARTTYVAKARKDQGNCESCGKPIPAGTPYKWVKPRPHPGAVGHKRKRHQTCPDWRSSELTSSPALSELYGAQESASDALAQWDREDKDALVGILNDLAEGVRSAGEVYRESAQNIEDGFGVRTYQVDELEEKADSLDGSADEVESAADQIEDFDESAVRAEVEDDALHEYVVDLGGDPEAITTVEAAEDLDGWDAEVFSAKVDDLVQEKLDEWADEAESIVTDAIDAIEVP